MAGTTGNCTENATTQEPVLTGCAGIDPNNGGDCSTGGPGCTNPEDGTSNCVCSSEYVTDITGACISSNKSS